jgi:hypothetical protein
VEEVDVGEAEPRQARRRGAAGRGAGVIPRHTLTGCARARAPRLRRPQICSGLVGYVPEEELQARAGRRAPRSAGSC